MPPEISEQAPEASFPIVAIGASAGGLAAVTLLLKRLGDRPGVAVVLVQHLDAKHESNLVEILARVTSMNVEAVQDGALVRVDHVQVITPGVDVTIERGALRLAPRADHGPHFTIDTFFESLARDCGPRAVAVVLSGTGADGARGIVTVKSEGGITFAQLGAEHSGMPDSAVATGSVDFVMPAEDIADEIVRIGARPARSADDGVEDDVSFRKILAAIRQATSVDFAHYKATTLRRRMQRRAVLRRVATLHEYADLVASEPAEVEALAEEVLIHVTRFFRDPEVFELLKREIFPRVLAGRRGDSAIRVWVPGCSSGEEVYSIAIGLIEAIEDAGSQVSFKIFGTDVSRRAIDRARAGVYTENLAEDVSPGRLARFFLKTERGYEIIKDVRDRCIFATHDITHDPPFSKMDLISCRNLMIYLGPALQQRILPMFHYALNEPGFLVLGTAESIGPFAWFRAVDAKSRVYSRLPAPARVAFDFGDGRPWSAATPALARPIERTTNAGDVRREADRAILTAIAPAGVVVTDDLAIVEFRGDIAPYLEPAPGVATLDLLRMAREELRLTLRRTIDETRSTGKASRAVGVAVGSGEAKGAVDVDVIPFTVPPSSTRFFSVLFTERAAPTTDASHSTPDDGARAEAEATLASELTSTREYLQSVIEQLEAGNEELKAANEEIVSSNEELQSTNEELQTAKEELQATNEELRTVNDEMLERNVEATRLADDLTNVLSSVAIPIVILGRDSRIRRFTPAATTILNLIASDVGRPITDIQAKIRIPDLPALVAEVIQKLAPIERTVRTDEGRWYELVVRPYMTLDNRIDGAVLSVYDVDALKKAEILLAEARDYAESIVETMRECLVVLGGDLRVRSANRAFYEQFKTSAREVEGRRFDAIASGEWKAPALMELLERLVAGGAPADVRIELELPEIGRRVVLANGRSVLKANVILLALVDVTERTKIEERLAKSEMGFRHMLASAAEPILMIDGDGRLVFANEMAEKVFGYASRELIGRRVEELLPSRLRDPHAQDRAAFLAAPTSRKMGRGGEIMALHKDGTEFPVEVVLSPMDASEGRLVVTFVTDVSARRAAEREIAEYQAKLQRMAFEAALAEERERRRIAHDLHDRIGQTLALARIKLESVNGAATGDVQKAIEAATELIVRSVEDTRTLTFELSPPVLYDLGLKSALSWLTEEIERRTGVRVAIVDDGKRPPFEDAIAALLFRVVRELLTNVFKHAHTHAARVVMKNDGAYYEIAVEDEGVGFDVAKMGPTSGFGLFSVREQITRLGGTVSIESTPRKGTCVRLRVPRAMDTANATDGATG